MSENRKEIKEILNKINKKNKDIDEILRKKGRNYELFFMNLFKEIITELRTINTRIKNKEPYKIFLEYDKSFLYEMIKLFVNMKYYNITNDIIECLITKEYINEIISIIINLNSINNIKDENITKFNNNIINLITYFVDLNQKLLIENLESNKNDNLHNFLLIFSKYKNGRTFLYDCVRMIFLLFPENEKYKFFIFIYL